MNPYAAPRSSERAPVPKRKLPRWRLFVYSFLLYPVWFVVGGVISIGGSDLEIAIDAALFVAVTVLSTAAFLFGLLRGD